MPFYLGIVTLTQNDLRSIDITKYVICIFLKAVGHRFNSGRARHNERKVPGYAPGTFFLCFFINYVDLSEI